VDAEPRFEKRQYEDGDPEDVFDWQVEFIQESALLIAMGGLLQALPRTQQYRRLEREGRLISDAKSKQHRLQSEFHSDHVRRAPIGRVSVDLETNLRPGRLLRPGPAFSEALSPHLYAQVALGVFALCRSVVNQGIFGDARASYRKFLLDAASPCLRHSSGLGDPGLPLLCGDGGGVPDRLAVVPVLCPGLHNELALVACKPARVAFHIQAAEKDRLSHSGGGDAYQLMILQVALGALLIDVFMSHELRGDLIIRRGTGLDVLATP